MTKVRLVFAPIQRCTVNFGAERKRVGFHQHKKKTSTQYAGSDGDRSVIFVMFLSRSIQILNIFQD